MSMSRMINEYAANALADKLGLKYDNIIYPDRMWAFAWTVFTLAVGVRLLQTSPMNSWEMLIGIVSLCFFVRAVKGSLSVKELTPDSIVTLQQFFDDDGENKETPTETRSDAA